jgi:hypothetical protein
MARVFEEVLGIKTTPADWALRITTADAYVCFCRGNIYRRRSASSVFLPHDAALQREPLEPADLQWMIPVALFCPHEVTI